MPYVVSLIEDDTAPGQVIAHHESCPLVQQHREAGRPICSMLIEVPLPPEWPRAPCLGPVEKRAAQEAPG